ncbi:apicoplast pyruvate carrier 1-like [Ptychodera flava]|uniref:apicoplast pyruvate carrier 1-like n=1 Tax=Ptychodera flava TaxID=63121 RepID=UPI00396A3E7C
MALPWTARGVLVIAGGILVHLSLGTHYTFGNISPYIVSYIRERSKPSDLNYEQAMWIYALAQSFHGIAMYVGGFIDRKIGPSWTTLLGGALVSFGVGLTYFTIMQSFYAVLITYGLMFGIGVGVAYAPPLAAAMRWFPNRKGLVSGCIVGGFGFGAFVFNPIQTAFVNPDNLSPNTTDPDDPGNLYFDQKSVLDRTPYCFIMLGVVYFSMQIIGSCMVRNPPVESEDESGEREKLIVKEGEEETKKPVDERSAGVTMGPGKMIRTRAFWTLWCTYLFNTQTQVLISTLYKAFGQTFIADDLFLALVGSFSSVCNALGRVMWGYFADRFSYKKTMLVICAVNTFFMLTLKLTDRAGEAMFLIWVCGVFLSFSGNFALFPTATARSFGQEYIGMNYGLMFTATMMSAITGSFLANALADSIGWLGLFVLCALFSAAAFVLTLTFNVKTPAGKNI